MFSDYHRRNGKSLLYLMMVFDPQYVSVNVFDSKKRYFGSRLSFQRAISLIDLGVCLTNECLNGCVNFFHFFVLININWNRILTVYLTCVNRSSLTRRPKHFAFHQGTDHTSFDWKAGSILVANLIEEKDIGRKKRWKNLSWENFLAVS